MTDWYNKYVTVEAAEVMRKYGVDPDVAPSGSSCRDITKTWPGINCLLRSWICQLDGVEVDGHEAAEPEFGEYDCLHCGAEGEY